MKEKLSNDKLAIAGPHIPYCRCFRHLPFISLSYSPREVTTFKFVAKGTD